MRAAAIVRLSRSRASHQPRTTRAANSTMPYVANASMGPCSQGVLMAKSLMASNRPLAGGATEE